MLDTFFIGAGDINRTGPGSTVVPGENHDRSEPRFLLRTDGADGDPPEGREAAENTAAPRLGTKRPSVRQMINENDADDQQLSFVLSKLVEAHQAYFEALDGAAAEDSRKPTEIPDIKAILDSMRSQCLRDCHICFSGIIPLGMPPEHFELWRLAEMFGARCTADIIAGQTTHLISLRTDTDKVLRAVEMGGVNVVTPGWLFACLKSWSHVDEDSFLVKDLPPPHGGGHSSRNSSASLNYDDLAAMHDEVADALSSDADDAQSDPDEEGEEETDDDQPAAKRLALSVEYHLGDDDDDFDDDRLSKAIEDELL